MTVLHAALEGLLLVFSWPNILYPVLGTLAAMLVAGLPGVSGVMLMTLAIPLTFQWEPLQILLLFGALVGGATYMGSVSAILLNIPGSAPNAATLIDGYPLARKGEARTALAASATASALGSSFGILFLILLIPAVATLVPYIGPAEYLMLAIWGLGSVTAVLRGGVLKGIAMALLGLLLALIGLDPRSGEPRFTLGTLFLEDGLSVVPIFLGLFAISEVIDLRASGRVTVSGLLRPAELTGSALQGVLSVFRNYRVFLRSSVIGSIIGMFPGLGGPVAAFVAYGDAARAAGPTGNFGHGDIRGVIAAEAANDAKDGGALLPTLALGIPAGAGTAVLLGVLALHGIRPGQELLTTSLPLTFALIWALFLSNWITSLVGLSLVAPLSWLTVVRTDRLVIGVLLLSAIGALTYRSNPADIVVAFGFGVAGYLLKKFGWPRIPLVIALVLAPTFEQNLNLTIALHQLGRIHFWSRPGVVLITMLFLLTVVVPTIRSANSWYRR